MAFRIEDIELGDDTSLLAELVACWRPSVEATHTFLTPDDIERHRQGMCGMRLHPSRTWRLAVTRMAGRRLYSVSMAL